MPRITRTMQLNDKADRDIVDFLDSLPTGEGQAVLKQVVRWGMEQYKRGGGKLPPPAPPVAPTPAVAIDYQRIGEVVYQAMRQALSEVQIAIPTGAALNEVEPEKVKDDHMLDEIMAGLGSWT